MSDKVKLIPISRLRQMTEAGLRQVGVRKDIIHPVADGLCWTSLRGIDSHGIRLLPHYIEGVKAGRLNPNPEISYKRTGHASGTLDADHTLGHAAGVEAMRHAISLAKESGIGAISVRNSSHCGALSYFAKAAAEEEMIGMVFTHATARVRTPGSNRAFFGNNPLCFVAPMRDEEPFCFDSATTGTTFNAVKAAAAAGHMLPPGLVAAADGSETTDPRKAEQLLPIGNYKGFGLSMMVDILCALLSGMPNGNNVSKMFGDPMSKKRELGHFFCALRIDAFRDVDEFKADLQEMADRLRQEPLLTNSSSVLVPGDPEKRIYKERLGAGVPIPEYDMSALSEVVPKTEALRT